VATPLGELERVADKLQEVISRLRAVEGGEVLYTEADLRRILGRRVGREQRKIAEAEERIAELEEEIEELRRELHTGGTPLHSREDGF
jgi:chromosome segregation ATPase